MMRIGFDPLEEPVVATVEVWWDRWIKLWTIQKLDRDGNQIGETGYAAHKSAAVSAARLLAEETNAEVKAGTRASG